MTDDIEFELPKVLDRLLGTLAKVYEQEDERELQKILVNARVRIQEKYDYDGWDGGMWGHAVYLYLGEDLYLPAVRRKDEISQKITNELNNLQNFPNEWISAVFLELEDIDEDWRGSSGVLSASVKPVSNTAQSRIWGSNQFRLFISHKSEDRVQVKELKSNLEKYGISAFVAHEDVLQTTVWQTEIENALLTMNAMVAFMTPGFHDSDWTDQELGFAFGRECPIIILRLGRDPYGFIGKFQALTCDLRKAPFEIVKLLINQEQMLKAYLLATKNCKSFDHGNELAALLPYISHLSDHQVRSLIDAYRENSQLRGSFGFNGAKSTVYGDGLAKELERVTGKSRSNLGFV